MDPARNHVSANDWLRDFCLALKNVAMYSADHPRGAEYLDRAYESLRRAMGERRESVLSRREERLYIDQILLDREAGLSAQLARDLAQRGVESLVFHATLTPEEHQGLIRCLQAKPERVEEKGGFRQLLIDEGVSSIKANEVRPAPPSAAREILAEARARESAGPEALAEILADTLERYAELALEEHRLDRHEILGEIGRAVVAADPDVHPPLFLEKADPRSIRKNLVAAVEGLPPGVIADLVAVNRPLAEGDFRVLSEMLGRTMAWRADRAATLASIRRRLHEDGLEDEAVQDLIDHLQWNEIPLSRRVDLLRKGGSLWMVDFSRVKETLARLLTNDQVNDATDLIQCYMDGLSSPDPGVRRRVADNARYVLQTIEKVGKGRAMLRRIADLFLARLHEDEDGDIVARLAGGLAFLVDQWLRSGELRPALEVLRKAEQLNASTTPALRGKGAKLSEALARAGNDRTFGHLAGMLLEGSEQESLEAAELLKRGGGRIADYLIERLAQEENRSHRARLVSLLKEMGKASSAPFVSRLRDPRWFLVRNVVGILGDIGDAAVIAELRSVASHHDPRVRREVVRTLARLDTPESQEMIHSALGDEDRGVQITAVGALTSLKGRKARETLEAIARRQGTFADVAVELRQEALSSLVKAKAPECFTLISDVLTRRGFLGYAEPTELRAAAARALGSLGGREALALLEDLAAKDSRQAVRDAAREALQKHTKAQVNRAG